MTSILIIPDCHSKPESSSDRFTWLGRYIVYTKPDTIVCLGDFLDMRSLSSYDKGKRTGEGQRVKADLEAGLRDQKALEQPIIEYNLAKAKNRKKQYCPDTYFLMGNHEARLDKYLNDTPALDGMLNYDFLEEFWDEVIPFLSPLVLENIKFSHYFPTKIGRAMGGVSAARTILNFNKMSCVAGHTHELKYDVETRGDRQKMFGLVAGWYGDMDHDEGWSRGSDHTWWNGVTVLHEVKDGFPEHVEFVSQKSLKERYG